MGNSYNLNTLLVAGALSLSSALPLSATTIFSNTNNDLSTRFNPGTLQVGDEIVLAAGPRYLTNFSFEYWGVNVSDPNNQSFAGQVQARVRLYYNDGAPFSGYATPSSVFYDSGLFNIPTTPLGRATISFNTSDFIGGLPIFILNSDITWSVQFSGMQPSDSVGLDIFSPPTVGQDFPDYWANNGSWQLLTNTIPMDFAAQFNAQANIPEPSVVTLSVVGGLGLLAFACRLRRKE